MQNNEETLHALLRDRFRLQTFRKGQLAILSSIIDGNDTLAVMPTGGGKSLCYQLPAVAKPGIVVVISPLIALMNDQVRSLQNLGIPAGCVHSGQSREEQLRTFGELKRSQQFLLYLSPERVQKPGFAAWIRQQKVTLFAVDESHCVSQWGPDFRQDYYKLNLLRDLRPDVPILALTATATPPVLLDIQKQLQLKKPSKHIHGFYRPNLFYQVESCTNTDDKMAFVRAALMKTPKGRVLIYCGTRKQTEEITAALSNEFSGVGFYHAGLKNDERDKIQKDYETSKLRILAATNAFGMGIDHPDVRLVIHFQMPANIEAYYQEMGRAGRDGEDATCLLLYAKRDKALHSHFIKTAQADPATIKRRWRSLDTMVLFVEGGECRHAGILTYFHDSSRLKACGHCDTCLPESPRRIDALEVPTFEASVTASKKKKKPKTVLVAALTAEEEVRAEHLKGWRKTYAEEHDIPAFLVFSNKTLSAIAQKNPATLEELRDVYGMGDHKVEHLGPIILEQLEACR